MLSSVTDVCLCCPCLRSDSVSTNRKCRHDDKLRAELIRFHLRYIKVSKKERIGLSFLRLL